MRSLRDPPSALFRRSGPERGKRSARTTTPRSDEISASPLLAVARELALLEANRLDIQSAPVAATRAEEPLGERLGLNIYTRSKNCLTDNEISEDERTRLMIEEARIEWVRTRSGIGRKEHLIDELRLSGEYTRLRVGLRTKASARYFGIKKFFFG